jgi:hypothetical protein
LGGSYPDGRIQTNPGVGVCGTNNLERRLVQLSITSAAGIRSSGRKVCPASGFARKGVTTLDTDVKRARDRAEAAFKKKEQQLREGQQAMAEYQAARAATREKTARLRALRLARDAGLKTPVPAAQKQPA